MSYKTKNIDELGAKSGLLKLAGEKIETPTRVLTSKESEQGDKLESKHLVSPIFYPVKIVQFTKNFNEEQLNSFASQSEVSYSLQSELNDFDQRFSNSISIFHPNIPSFTTVGSGKKKTRKPLFITPLINRKLMQAQLNAKYEIITVQEKHPSSSPTELEERIKSSQKFLDDSEAETGQLMISLKIAMKENEFKEKLKVVADSGLKLLEITSASVGSYLPNLDYIAKFGRQHDDIYIHGAQIDRTWRGNKITSLMHLAQLFGYDSFAVKLFPPIPLNKPFVLVRDNAKRFDGRTLGLIRADEHQKLHGNNLGDECPVCKERNLDNFFDTFSGVKEGVLRSALNVHEFFDSFSEFEESKSYINQDDYRNYAKGKKYLEEAVKKVLGIDLRQNPLSWFKKK